MLVAIKLKGAISSAHYLPGYKGKCANLHGHNWDVEVGVEGAVDPNTGMVIDFTELKPAVKSVAGSLDHKLLNDIIPMPTAENVVDYIWRELEDFAKTYKVKLAFVRVWETDTSYAELRVYPALLGGYNTLIRDGMTK